VNGEKMSKSLGNYTSMAELLGSWDPEVIRFYLLSTHFRSRAEFETAQLERAKAGLERIRECSLALHERLQGAPEHLEARAPAGEALVAVAARAQERWREAMEDDFNSGGAIGHIFELVREFNRLADEDDPGLRADRKALEAARDALALMTGVLGLFREGLPTRRELAVTPELEALLERRNAARAAKDWAEADRLRDAIQAQGFQVLDGPDGSQLRPL
jgi:cysteinyl-tRNA synthetase